MAATAQRSVESPNSARRPCGREQALVPTPLAHDLCNAGLAPSEAGAWRRRTRALRSRQRVQVRGQRAGRDRVWRGTVRAPATRDAPGRVSRCRLRRSSSSSPRTASPFPINSPVHRRRCACDGVCAVCQSECEGNNGLLAAAMLSGATGGIGEIFDCLPISAAAAAQGLPKHDPGNQPSQLSGDGSFPSALLPPPQPMRPAVGDGYQMRRAQAPRCSRAVVRALRRCRRDSLCSGCILKPRSLQGPGNGRADTSRQC